MNKILENMINRQIYEKEEIISKLDLFVLFNRIKIEDYATLMQLILDVYIEVEENNEEVVKEEIPNVETENDLQIVE